MTLISVFKYCNQLSVCIIQVKGVEEPLAEAEELVNLIYAQRQLENACLDRSIDDIEIAIEKIKSGTFLSYLTPTNYVDSTLT